jgi:hypothetical protein
VNNARLRAEAVVSFDAFAPGPQFFYPPSFTSRIQATAPVAPRLRFLPNFSVFNLSVQSHSFRGVREFRGPFIPDSKVGGT